VPWLIKFVVIVVGIIIVARSGGGWRLEVEGRERNEMGDGFFGGKH
jgi:hypothetical protein